MTTTNTTPLQLTTQLSTTKCDDNLDGTCDGLNSGEFQPDFIASPQLQLSTRMRHGSDRQAVTNNTCILLSDSAQLQSALQSANFNMCVITRTMILDSTWMETRDRVLLHSSTIVMELPHCRTASGTKHDRKVMDRMTSYLRLQSPTMRFVLIAPRRSNSWELREVQQCCNATGVQASFHQWCSMGAVSPQTSLPLRMTTKCVSNFILTDSPCKCGTKEHGYDVPTRDGHQQLSGGHDVFGGWRQCHGSREKSTRLAY